MKALIRVLGRPGNRIQSDQSGVGSPNCMEHGTVIATVSIGAAGGGDQQFEFEAAAPADAIISIQVNSNEHCKEILCRDPVAGVFFRQFC
jgi:hypothetical protein